MHNGGIMLLHLPRAAFTADLPHRFDQQIKPIHARIAVGQAAAICIHREGTARRDAAIGDKPTAFTLFAKA